MKFSLNLAQYYSNVDLKSIAHEKIVAKAGAQLGGIEEVIDWAPRYSGAVVVKIVTVSDHPDADRLHICMIDDGGVIKDANRNDTGLIQVVCGAPNVRDGLFVVWLPPGATVPASYNDTEPFVLGARELRGVISNGMLASAKELGISDDHDGILEIDARDAGRSPKPGEPFVSYFGMDDLVLDFENKMFTHRPDCFGVLGIARELAGINGLRFKSPDWWLSEPEFENKNDVKLSIKNEAGTLVPHLMAVAMSNITVSKSPVWLQAALARMGMKTINNVVDITNYIMALTSQPLHAYDADKLGSTLIARMAQKGETLALLNGKTVTLTEADIVIANTEKPVGLAAIMGGSETEVDLNTKNIVIECANFDMYTVRRSSMHHGIFSDASTRFTKGQSALQNSRVVWYAMKNLMELAGAKQTSSVYDVHSILNEPADVTVTAEFINERLGSRLSLADITKLLENVEFTIKTVPADKNHLHIKPPFWRTDIEMPEDIVEEVGRLYGFENLPVALPARSAKAAPYDEHLTLKHDIRTILAEAGANEVLTYSFVHGNLLKKVGQPEDQAYALRNALSPDLQFYRMSITPSLLDKVHMNLRAGYDEFALFELNKSHVKQHGMTEENVPKELNMVTMVYAANDKSAPEGAVFYQARHYLDFLAHKLGIVLAYGPIQEDMPYPVTKPFDWKRSALVYDAETGTLFGQIGEYRDEVRKNLKLPTHSAGFELSLEAFAQCRKPLGYKVTSRFPSQSQDITLQVGSETAYKTITDALVEAVNQESSNHGFACTISSQNIYAPSAGILRYTYRVTLSHPARTLVTTEVNTLLDNVARILKEKVSAERI